MIEDMEKEAALIKQESLKMCWYMRGGLTYDQIMNFSNQDRRIVGDLIKENLETTKKSGMPFF